VNITTQNRPIDGLLKVDLLGKTTIKKRYQGNKFKRCITMIKSYVENKSRKKANLNSLVNGSHDNNLFTLKVTAPSDLNDLLKLLELYNNSDYKNKEGLVNGISNTFSLAGGALKVTLQVDLNTNKINDLKNIIATSDERKLRQQGALLQEMAGLKARILDAQDNNRLDEATRLRKKVNTLQEQFDSL
jgi:hypothetical protein